MKQCQRLSKCERVFLFVLFNPESNPWTQGYENYGLIKRNGEIKPRYCGVQKYLVGQKLSECGGTDLAETAAEAEVYYNDNTPVADEEVAPQN